MNLTRRDFLKSLLAVATVAAVPLVADEVLFDEIDRFLDQGGDPPLDMRPSGEWGSLRLDDRWYAVHGASLTAQYQVEELQGDDEVLNRYLKLDAVDIECQLDMFAEGELGVRDLHEFELRMAHLGVLGQAEYKWHVLGNGRTQLMLRAMPPLRVVQVEV